MRYVFACLLAVIFTMSTGSDAAKAGSIAGAWSGEGLVSLTTGQSEKIRCRLRYEESSGRTLVVHVTCSHAHGVFKTTGRVVKLSNTRYSGRLYSEQHDVAGQVTISVNGRSQKVRATSSKGSATVNLTRR